MSRSKSARPRAAEQAAVSPHMGQDRRAFLRFGAAAASLGCAAAIAGQHWALAAEPAQGSAAAPAAASGARPPEEKPLPLKLGLASYSFRKFDLDQALAMTKRVGLTHFCVKSFHMPLEADDAEIAVIAEKIRRAGFDLYAGGVIRLEKPEEVDRAFTYAKAASLPMINTMPSPEMLPLIDKKVREFDIVVAVHNHGPTDKHFPTPQNVYDAIKGLDPRVGVCIDIGHTVRVGANLVESVELCADRLIDLHIKDVEAAKPEAHEVVVGRGVIDIPALLRTLEKIHYSGIVAFEFEPDPTDPLAGLAESVGYTRGVLSVV